jgi:hypothetical protein
MSEVVLIEFIGDAKSGVAAADEQVAANERVAASTKGIGVASASASAPVGTLGNKTKLAGQEAKKTSSLFHEHGKITSGLGSIYGNTAKSAGALVAAYLGFSALKDAVGFTEELVHNTQILTNVTGLNAKSASQWIELAKQRELATSKLTIGFSTLSKQIREAETGSSTAAKGFHALKIPLDELRHLSTEEVLLKISDGLKNTANYANKAALTQQFFGKSGRELLPIIAQGSKALESQLHRFGGLSEAQQKAGEEAREFQRKISRLYDELRIKVSFALLDAGKSVAKWIHEIGEGKTDIAKTIQDIGHILGPILKNYIDAAVQTFKGFAQLLKGICEVIQGVVHLEFSKAWQGIKDIFSGGVKVTIGIMHSIASPIIGIAESLGVKLNSIFGDIWSGIGDVFKSGINDVIGFINDLINAINVIPGVPNIGSIGEIGASKSPGNLEGENRKGSKKLHHQHRARGGSIFEGTPSGDSVPAMLERGEYVLNRKAVQRVGKGKLDALNFHQAPRFAFGGAVGEAIGEAASSVSELPGKALGTLSGALGSLPHPHLPGWIQGLGEYLASEVASYITSGFQEKKFGSLGGVGGVSLKGISGSVAAQAAQIAKRVGAPHNVTLALFEALWAESSMGSAAPGNVLEALEPYTKVRPAAQEISGFLTGHPKWTGTTAMSLASSGMQPYEIAQAVQKSGAGAASHGASNYGAQKARALATMAKFGLAKGGLIGMAAGGSPQMGSPARLRFLSSEGGPADAAHAVAWAKHHLGSSDRWGYPGEWCGAFLGADMLAHGIQPPSNYPLASAWGSWGTSGSSAFGNVVVIGGSGHVGLSLGGGRMISGNFSDKVAESSIAEAAGGRPITGYRVPPYSGKSGSSSTAKPPVPKQLTGPYAEHRKGQTSPGGGTYAETVMGKYKVQTGSLSFGSVPSTIEGCRKELRLRRQDLGEYRAAISHTKDPTVKRALQANLKAIQKRIKELVAAISKMLRERKREGIIHKIEGRGLFPKIKEAISNRERGYNEASEFAEQIVALEPENGAAAYIAREEGPAWQKVLSEEAGWRNAILGGEQAASGRLNSLETQLSSIEALKSTHPKAYKKQKFRIPALKSAITAVREVWSPGKKGPTGGFEEGLENLQGPGKSHALLPSLPTEPVAGSFGGLIFDTQMTIRELGLKIKQASEGGAEGESNSALLEAEKAIAEQAVRGRRLAELQYGPLSEFLKHMPPYIGAFKTGTIGPLPGSPHQAYTATVHGGEHIVPAGVGGSTFILNLHGDMAGAVDSAMPGMVKEVDKRMGQNYRRLVYGPGGRKR